MPIHRERDDVAERITVKSIGDITFEEVMQTLDWQAEQGAWSFGLLYDARESVAGPGADDMFRLVQRVGALTAAHGPRGPVAFVVSPNHPLLNAGHKYSRLGELTALNVKVFTDLEAAERWLAEEQGS
jgi:hypothetical protein